MSIPFAKTMAQNWWVLLLRGLLGIAFGILTFAWPAVTLVSLILTWGVWAIADGIVALTGGASDRHWASLLIGICGTLAGLGAFFYPGLTALILLYFFAAWVIAKGILEICAAIALRKVIENEWLLILAGAMGVLLGILLFMNPGAGALAMLWLLGAYAILFGLLLVLLSFRLKKLT